MPNLRPADARPSAATGASPPQSTNEPGLSFTIGQDAGGCWVALESHGVAGGLFRNRDDAIHYAGGEIRNAAAGEIRFATGPLAFTIGR